MSPNAWNRDDPLRSALLLVICTCLIMVPAIINGFPLVYSDTGTYLRSAFQGFVPVDRPYWYGVFIRLTSLSGRTLWGVVLAQSLLSAVYVLRFAHALLPSLRARITTFAAVVLLSVTTGLGWYACQLMPDLFTAVGALAVFLLLCGEARPWSCVLDVLVIIAACWVHLSHLVILPVIGFVLLIATRRSELPLRRERTAWLMASILLSWAGLAAANRAVDGKWYISRGGHAFLMGRSIDTGLLRPWLEEHCPAEHYGICAYIDSLPPSSKAFLWGGNSPLVKQGGWDATREEYGRIIRGTFTEPRYLMMHIRGSLASTAQQLRVWDITSELESTWYRTSDSPPYQMIEATMPHELASYRASLQNGGNGELSLHWPDRAHRMVLLASLVCGIVQFFRRRRTKGSVPDRVILLFAVSTILIDAWVCATLSAVETRYLARALWVLPVAVMVVAARAFRQGRDTEVSSPH